MLKKFFSLNVPIGLVMAFFFVAIAAFGFAVHFIDKAEVYNLFVGNIGIDPAPLQFGAVPALGDFDFFSKTRDRFISDKADFIEANLSDMVLSVYKKGEQVKEVTILTKGREGSWWETPAGIYRVESKEDSHFSSFGHVYQPWSMAFQGNFFIHGWPYYPDGKAVAQGYSGGCIRLSDEDAKAVFDLVSVGTPVMVFEKDFASDGFSYKSKPPELSAREYLVGDLKNNFVFLERSGGDKVPVASITKIMTALVAGEFINLEKEITVPLSAIVYTSKPRLKAGTSYSAYDLLYPLLLESSNEAADAFAAYLGNERFVTLMNEKAKAVGMSDSYFTDPSGKDDSNLSTAEDLFNLAKYVYNNRGFIFGMSSGRLTKSVYGEPQFSDLSNFNLFGDDPDFIGGKIGKTSAAHETMLAVFDLELSGEKRPVAIIMLGSDEVGGDVRKAVDWLKANY
ncbi:MAG: L,D-transpeptidase family protein [Candidatus Colwellbacteria bacterium]|nr:L,D-transpeptidase family protein [Candidatus Colwellbacteria bacterium]